ncbi:MAG TPA: GspH/FimT family pseudopilin [Candidatus Obscuribacterales bacterium]
MRAGKGGLPRGFTLIELLVTIAVLVVIATIAVPNFQQLVKSNLLVASHNEILTGVSLAREEAVKRREAVTAVLSLDDSGDEMGWLLEVRRNGGTILVRSIDQLDSPVTVQSSPTAVTVGSPLTVTFNALGRASESANLTISDDATQKCLSINLAGVASKEACGG